MNKKFFRSGSDIWSEFKVVLEQDNILEYLKSDECTFIQDYQEPITHMLPNVDCVQSHLYLFGVACLCDATKNIDEAKAGIDLLFDKFKHDCFENKNRVIDIMHYFALSMRVQEETAEYGMRKLLEYSKAPIELELQRFKYAVGCDNKAFTVNQSHMADPTPYALEIGKRHFYADAEEWHTHLANLIDVLTFRGKNTLNILPPGLPKAYNIFEHIEPVEDSQSNSTGEDTILELIGVLIQFELIKRAFR